MKYGEISQYEAIFTDDGLDEMQIRDVKKNGGKLMICS